MKELSPTYAKAVSGFRLLIGVLIASLALTACASSTGVGATQPSFSEQVASVVAATLSTFPTRTPEPSPEPMDQLGCTQPTEGTAVLTREAMGYCLLYPADYIEVETDPTQICLVSGEPLMACHSANAFINVESAAGRTADQIADEIIADQPRPEVIKRSNLMIGGEKAVMLDGLAGVDISRKIIIVHADRLYTLMFVPWDEAGEDWARIESLHETVINSFSFLPTAAGTLPPPVQSTPIPQTLTPTALSCPNALPARLQVGGYAYVSLDPPLSNRVRNGPGSNSGVIGDIGPGDAMKILNGPECVQGSLWWEVQAIEGGLTGWTAEGDSKDYWLVPCSSPTGCGTP